MSNKMVDALLRYEYKEQYQIMSVPCIVIDQQHVLFGKKTMEEMIQVLEKLQSK